MIRHTSFSKIASGYRLIFGYLGIFIVVSGIITLLPLFALIFYPSESSSFLAFLIPGVSAIGGGLALSLLIRKREKAHLEKFQDSILLVLIWIVAILINSIPFMLRGLTVDFNGGGINYTSSLSMGFSEAVFETTSGFATVGLSLFNLNPTLPGYHLFTLYRAVLLLFGGVGLVLVVASAISDKYGLRLYTAEGHNDKLMPNLAKSARMILLIYLGYILLGALSFWLLGGLTFFDSLCHSISAVATGGFSSVEGGLPAIIQNSTYVNEIGLHPNEIAINITACVLMVLGATNFAIHLMFLKGKIKDVIKDCEIRFFVGLSIITIPLLFISIWMQPAYNSNPALALGEGTFLYFSSITTTGFATISPMLSLGQAAVFITVVLMCIGGGIGSTAGAIKQYRIVIDFKTLYWSIRERLNSRNKVFPHTVYRHGQNKEVDDKETYEALSYTIIYLLFLGLGALLITIFGIPDAISYGDALFEFASALSSAGLTVGVTSLAYQNSVAINWVLTIGMFAGRLEIVIIHFAFYRFVRDLLRKETI